MRSRLILAIGLFTLCEFVSCSRSVPAPPEDPVISLPPIATKAPDPGQGDPEPQDLEPVETRRSYGARDPDPLLDGVEAEFSMVCMPSFTRSYAVALVGSERTREKDSDEPHYSILFAADENRQWRGLEKGSDPRRLAEVDIDPKSAQLLQEAWESVVRRTRYPRPRYEYWQIGDKLERVESSRIGVDGITYRFECGKYCGTTWSPKAELTWGIVELGDALRDYALADEANRPKRLARCLEFAKKLQSAAERRPW